MKQFVNFLIGLLLTLLVTHQASMAQTPVMSWDFETIKNRNAIEESDNIADTIEGSQK